MRESKKKKIKLNANCNPSSFGRPRKIPHTRIEVYKRSIIVGLSCFACNATYIHERKSRCIARLRYDLCSRFQQKQAVAAERLKSLREKRCREITVGAGRQAKELLFLSLLLSLSLSLVPVFSSATTGIRIISRNKRRAIRHRARFACNYFYINVRAARETNDAT